MSTVDAGVKWLSVVVVFAASRSKIRNCVPRLRGSDARLSETH